MDNQQEDLKEVISLDDAGAGQPEEPVKEEVAAEAQAEAPTETIDELKSRLQKAEEERENYKQSLLSKKKEWNKKLESPKEEEPEEVYPDWDETSKKFQKQTLSEAVKIAEKTAQQRIEKSNESQAIEQFLTENPDVDMNEIVANYTSKNGKESVKNILTDLKRAQVLTRFEKGELSDEISFKKGESKGKADTKLAELSSISSTRSKAVKDKPALSEGALRLAERMRVDKTKLAAEDESLTAEIRI